MCYAAQGAESSTLTASRKSRQAIVFAVFNLPPNAAGYSAAGAKIWLCGIARIFNQMVEHKKGLIGDTGKQPP